MSKSVADLMPDPAIVGAVLDGVVRALADRPHYSDAQKAEAAHRTMAMILSLLPRDTMQLHLLGQVALFAAATADLAHDVMTKYEGKTKLSGLNTMVRMGSLVARQLDTFRKLQDSEARVRIVMERDSEPALPAQPEAQAPRPEKEPAQTAPAQKMASALRQHIATPHDGQAIAQRREQIAASHAAMFASASPARQGPPNGVPVELAHRAAQNAKERPDTR